MTLSYLISKSDWNGVCQRLQAAPEEASMPIPTGFKGTVYALHQAICRNVNPIPKQVLHIMIEQYPNALDLNAFVGACENSQLSRGSMELLLDCSSPEIYQAVQLNAHRFVSIAIKKKNICTVQVFIERFPSILNGTILAHACMNGTAEIVQMILAAGVRENVGKCGGLFFTTDNREDALDIAIRLYDEKDEERRHILVTCLRYANATKMGMKVPDPNYSVILAAIGLVPRHILGSILKLYAHEVINTNQSGKHAIHKAIRMSMEKGKEYTLPPIFKSEAFIHACSHGKLELVKKMLEKSAQYSCEDVTGGHSETVFLNVIGEINALDVAIDLFDENDDTRCKILQSCIQYANAINLKRKVPSSNYPTILAAVGLVPTQVLLSIGRKFHNEIKEMDRTGKVALKKVLNMAQEEAIYATRLDMRCQYPLSIKTNRLQFSNSLKTIPQRKVYVAKQ